MSRLHHIALVPGALAVTLLAACAPDAPTAVAAGAEPFALRYDPGVHRIYGTPTKVGDGMARTYVVLDEKEGRMPIELGVALDARVLEGLPETPGEYELALPPKSPAPYQVIALDWNPTGHPPAGVYMLPHFDFHFYAIDEAQIAAIDPADPQLAAKANALPTDGDVPQWYVPLVPPGGTPADAAVPHMGVHWFDVRSPEFHGGTFTRTFIYGSWDGRFTFYEPMVTLDYLRSAPDVIAAIPVPQHYPVPGWYPTSYRVTYDAKAKEYLVALSGLALRE